MGSPQSCTDSLLVELEPEVLMRDGREKEGGREATHGAHLLSPVGGQLFCRRDAERKELETMPRKGRKRGAQVSVLEMEMAGFYTPRTKETREAYEALLGTIHGLFGDQPQVPMTPPPPPPLDLPPSPDNPAFAPFPFMLTPPPAPSILPSWCCCSAGCPAGSG